MCATSAALFYKVRVSAQEMRGGPLELACRSRLQTTLNCAVKEPGWLALRKSHGHRTVAGVYREDERLRTTDKMSKIYRWCQNRGSFLVSGQAQRIPVYSLCGTRHKGGMIPIFKVLRKGIRNQRRHRYRFRLILSFR
jgi:hypothetical protein